MGSYNRADRVRSQMLRDVRELLDQKLAGKFDGMVTFTDVEITKDLKYATIFYSFLGSSKARLKAADHLSRIRGRVQGQLGRLLAIKFIPEIKFKFDPSIERGFRIEQLLNQIADEKKEPDETDT